MLFIVKNGRVLATHQPWQRTEIAGFYPGATILECSRPVHANASDAEQLKKDAYTHIHSEHFGLLPDDSPHITLQLQERL